MAVIEWVQYDERVVGENSPIYPTDVTNRPLKQLLTDSDLDSTADFPGFPAEYKGTGSPEGVQTANPGQLYFQEDAPYTLWIKATGTGTNTGWAEVGAAPSGTGNFIPKFTAAGDDLEDSIMYQTVAPSVVAVIVGTDPLPAANERFRTSGGIISKGAGLSSTIIGEGPTAAGVASVAIGYYAVAAGTGSIAIGESATVVALADLHGVAIGRSSIVSGEYSVAIGTAVTASGNSTVCFGNGATASGNNTIAIGNSPQSIGVDTIAVGRSAIANALDSIVIGRNSFTGLNTTGGIAIGSGASLAQTNSNDLNDSMVIGYGSVISSATLTAGGFPSAIVAIGPRITVSAAGGQPADYLTIVGAGNSITAPLGASNGQITAIGQFITTLTGQNLVIIGNSISIPSQASNSVVIGNAPSITPSITGCTFVGDGISMAGGNFATIIGRLARKIGANGDYAIAIGYQATVNNIDYALAIGQAATVSGGTGNMAIGRAATVTHANAGVIGPGATSERANSFLIGSDNTGGDYQTYIFGNRGDTSPSGIADVTWRPTSAETGGTSNLAVAALKISGGIPLGNDATANSGEIQFFTGAPGASSNSAQTATKQVSILKSAGGAGAANFAIDNVTTAAAGGFVGTLTNAPTAGNPVFWVPIRIMGNVRYFPVWP